MATPTAHYRLDEAAATTAVVDTVNGYNGTASRNTIFLASRLGFSTLHPCYRFVVGASDIITLPSNVSARNQTLMSFACWFIPLTVPSTATALWYESINGAAGSIRFAVRYLNAGTVVVTMRGADADGATSLTSAGTLTIGTKYLIVATINTVSNNINLYINAAAETPVTSAINNFANTAATFGPVMGLQNAAQYIDGKIWNAKIYVGTELSQAEVTALYNSGNGVAEDYTYANIAALGYPATTDTRNATSYANGVYTGTCAVPAATNVRFGTAVDATTGTAYIPSASDVRFGTNVDATTGTAYIPTAANTRFGTNVDATTGTCKVPTAANVRSGIAVDVSDTGTIVVPSAADVRFGTNVDVTTGTCYVPVASNVLVGVNVDATTGTFDEAARNTDPGIINVKLATAYKIQNVSLIGTLAVGVKYQLPFAVNLEVHKNATGLVIT